MPINFRLFKEDIAANLPGVTVPERLYYATDTKSFDINDGLVWNPILTSGNAPLNDPAVWIDPRSRGASTSASASTNTTAFQAALNAGPTILPADGTYNYDTTLAVPLNGSLSGRGQGVLNYTGASNGISLNPGTGIGTNWDSTIRDIRLTTSTGTVGIYLKDVSEVTIFGNLITGFSSQAIQSDPTAATGGNTVIKIWNNYLKSNGRGIRFTGANIHNAWSIIGNEIQGSTTGPGIQADQQVIGFELSGNTIQGNKGIAEVVFGHNVYGLHCSGNYFESSNGVAMNAIVFSGGGGTAQSGVTIIGNYGQNDAANATGRFFYYSGAGTPSGFIVRGNTISQYGVVTNPAIDGGSKTFIDSDFSANAFIGVTVQYGNGIGGSDLLPWKVQINPLGWYSSHLNSSQTFNGGLPFGGYRGTTVAQNSFIAWDVTLAAGTWEIYCAYTGDTNTGIIHFQIDGSDVATQDTYNAGGTVHTDTLLTGIAIAASGKHSFKVIGSTKNAGSTGYAINIAWIEAIRTA